jgi:hypothetical protein
MVEIKQEDLPKYIGKEVLFVGNGIDKRVLISKFENGNIIGIGTIQCTYNFPIKKEYPNIKFYING